MIVVRFAFRVTTEHPVGAAPSPRRLRFAAGDCAMTRPTTTKRMSVPKSSRSRQVPIEQRQSGTRHQHCELILQSIGEGVHGLDAAGRITFVNQSAATMLGWTEQDLLGRHQHPLIHHSRANGLPYPESECPILAALREGRVFRQDGDVFWRKDGSS